MSPSGPFCEYEQSRCIICGLETKRPDLRRNCYVKIHFIAAGDVVGGILSRAGITESRITKLLGSPCGCGKRKAALNKMGYIVQEQVTRLAARTRKALLGRNW